MNLPPQIRGLCLSDRPFEAKRRELFEKHTDRARARI